jgi:monovalent cation:H+ antiporter-2, CPA2 family
MVAEPIFFRDLAYIFLAAVVGGGLAWLARQPLILGYVVGGIAVSPFTPGPAVTHVHTFEVFAEIGVILLMYSIGMEFSLRDLLRVKWVALLGGPLGLLLSAGLGLGVWGLIGWPLLQGAVVGMVISVASTMVLARLLMDRGELRSRHGSVMIGITLVEDLAVVVLTILVPALGALESGRLVSLGVAFGKAALILVPFAFLAARVVPRLMMRVARTQSPELFLLVVLAIGLGTAALTQGVGLSLALGAFLAGLLISNSDYAHETLAQLLPLRHAFVALFFVTIGALIDPRTIFTNLPLLGVMIGLIVAGKFLIWTAVVWLFRYPMATAIMVGVGLTQIGEFSFVLVQVARGAGHVGDEVYSATLAASLLTILLNAALMRVVPQWLGAVRLARARRAEASTNGRDETRRGHVVICGFGRVGSAVGEALEAFDFAYTVIERDPDVVRDLRARGVPCLFGDAAHRELLLHAGAARRAALIVVALPEIEAAHHTVRTARTLNPQVPILARVHGRAEAERFRAAGATETIQPEVEASATLIRHALKTLHVPSDRALDYLERFRDAMEMARVDSPASDVLPEVHEVVLPVGGIADQTLRDARVRERFGVTVVAIARPDGVTLNPSPDMVLRSGDKVRVFGLPEQIAAFVTEAEAPR